ncbi:MAG TPA: hypothetical protein QF468_01370 [Nitrospinota bacterium]|jgi:hypothetical protein|nr:hypothetical protein [Nitrospinota bacterium]|tara:strand:- start:1480 stop:1713 length:234 start_codon:yes stop_codon:yes gene_type:complete
MARTIVSKEKLSSILTQRVRNDVDCTGYSVGEPEKHRTETADCNWQVGIRGTETVTSFGKRKVCQIIEAAQTEYNLK